MISGPTDVSRKRRWSETIILAKRVNRNYFQFFKTPTVGVNKGVTNRVSRAQVDAMTHNILRAWRRLFSLCVLLFPLVVVVVLAWMLAVKAVAPAKAEAATDASAPIVDQAPADVHPADEQSASSNDLTLNIGDHMNVAFFERLNFDEESKWAALSKSRRPPNNFYQRTEMSGTFQVEDNGSVVIPLLGPIAVAGKTVAAFEKSVEQAFEKRIGRFGFVSVQVQRQPIYVLGPVKKPGPYEFSPGMTVLHFLSLAGGIDRLSMDTSRLLQLVGEGEKRQKSTQMMSRLLARLSVLVAESEGHEPDIPQRLIDLAGSEDAAKLVRSEQSLRKLKVDSLRTEMTSLQALEAAANATLEQKRSLVTQIAASVVPQKERAESVAALAAKGTISNTVRLEAEASLSAVRERQQQAMIDVAEAESRVNQIRADRAKSESQAKLALAQEISSVRDEIGDAEGSLASSAAVLDAMRSSGLAGNDAVEDQLSFEVVRATATGHTTMNVPGTFALKPGDLIQVRTRTEGSSVKKVDPQGTEIR